MPEGEPWLPEHEGGARGDEEVLRVLVAPFDPEDGVVEGVLHGALHLHGRPDVDHLLFGDPTDGGGPDRANWGKEGVGFICQWDIQNYVN